MTKPNAVTRGTISLLPDHLLDIEEAAAFLNCCRATVRREVARGRLRAQKVGQRWRFAPEDLLAYLDSETAASAAERTEWDAYIRKVVAAAPPLRPEQVAALSALFDYQPAADGGGAR